MPAGAPLRGLGYIKGQEAPLAREDDEYPSWLWGLLNTGKEESDPSGPMGDAFGEYIVHSLYQLAPEQGGAQPGFQNMAHEIWAIRMLVISKPWSHYKVVSIAEANFFFNSQIKEATTPGR